jgi:C4-dicarboxylate transporter, DctM subunit
MGLNIFVINSLATDVPIMETFKGVIAFLLSDFLSMILLF